MTARILHSLRAPDVAVLREYLSIGFFYETTAAQGREQTYAEEDLVNFFLKHRTVPRPFTKAAIKRVDTGTLIGPDNWANLFANASPYVISRITKHDYKPTHIIPKNFGRYEAHISNVLVGTAIEERVIEAMATTNLPKHAKALLEFCNDYRGREQPAPSYALPLLDGTSNQ